MDSPDHLANQHGASTDVTEANQAVVLLTGVTGFLGKVVLEELVRRRIEGTIHFDRVLVLIRPSRGQTALERFADKVVGSRCFSRLPSDWHKIIEVISGDLIETSFGVDDETLGSLRRRTTHIAHCAGCVSFGSSLNVLLAENVTASQNILELAKGCPKLVRVVVVSTAYVTPHTREPIHEELVTLPRPARQILDEFHEGRKTADQVLAETGHPNYYTLAKCLGEHVIAENLGELPLTMVRPSIISASLRYPFPGWVDSFAALAGPISAYALGGLKVIHGDPSVVVDVVPVDETAKCIINETLLPSVYGSSDAKHLNGVSKIVHCVSTMSNGPSMWDVARETIEYFAMPENIVLYEPKGCYLGMDDRLFYFYEFFFQYLPVKLTELTAMLMLN